MSIRMCALLAVASILSCAASLVLAADETIQVSHLRCEYLVDPLHIDVVQPRLSWQIRSSDFLRITIQNWGVGFDPAAVRDDRFGLEGIRERARLLGSSATTESTPGQGARVTVELPWVLQED